MGCSKNLVCGLRIHQFAISFIICLVFVSAQSRLFNAEGRKLSQTAYNSKTVKEDKSILRSQIGSRPPRCQQRCTSCVQCEAIQVPTNPQNRNGFKNYASVAAAAYYARGADTSNYKPMSWKCKCGNRIFNP